MYNILTSLRLTKFHKNKNEKEKLFDSFIKINFGKWTGL